MNPENIEPVSEQRSRLLLAPVPKYLILVLMVTLPFLGGWVGYNIATEKVVEVEKLTSQELTNEQPHGVQDKRYRNASLGIEFSYPSDWIVTERESQNVPSYTGQQVILSHGNPSDGTIIISIMDNAILGSAHNSVTDVLEGTSRGKGSVTEATPIQVSGVDAVSYLTGHESSVVRMTFFEHQGYSYFIGMGVSDGQTPQTNSSAYQEVVRSFKLLEN